MGRTLREAGGDAKGQRLAGGEEGRKEGSEADTEDTEGHREHRGESPHRLGSASRLPVRREPLEDAR